MWKEVVDDEVAFMIPSLHENMKQSIVVNSWNESGNWNI